MRWELFLSHFWNEKTRLREAKSSPHVTQQPRSWDWRPGGLASGEGRLEVARLGWGGESLRGGGDRRKQTPPGKGEECVWKKGAMSVAWLEGKWEEVVGGRQDNPSWALVAMVRGWDLWGEH